MSIIQRFQQTYAQNKIENIFTNLGSFPHTAPSSITYLQTIANLNLYLHLPVLKT